MEARQSYVSRGRALHAEGTEKLSSSWIMLINAWADDKPNFDRLLMDDIEAELGLRGLKAPADEAGEAVKKLAAKSHAATDKWTLEEMEEAEKRVQIELAKIRPSKADKN